MSQPFASEHGGEKVLLVLVVLVGVHAVDGLFPPWHACGSERKLGNKNDSPAF